jgi:hypothetical protein
MELLDIDDVFNRGARRCVPQAWQEVGFTDDHLALRTFE